MRSFRNVAIAALAVTALSVSGCKCDGALAPLGVTVTAEPASGRAPLSVTFTALLVGDEGAGVAYDWDFGDGTPNATDTSPTHVFLDGGAYEVSVTVTRSDDGFTAVGTISIDVEPNSSPEVVIQATPDMGLEPLTVSFQSFVTGGDGSLSYSWDFGDGNSDAVPNPTHTYLTAGSYDATLTVVDDDGDTSSATVSIAVGSDEVPAPTATATPDTGSAPLVVDFDCTAIGGNSPLTFTWDFGDGATIGLAVATHTYSVAGVYQATCIVTDADGDSGSDSVTITVGTDSIPTAIATASYTGNAAPLAVTFTGIGLGGDAPLTYAWDFGDGNTSTMQNPNHTYTTPGVYSAILTVTDTDGDFGVDTATVVVGTGSVPSAVANANPVMGSSPLMVVFTGVGIGGDGTLTYSWDFGDGNTSTMQNPTHTYAADGTYSAILTVTDADGDFDVDSVTIVVGTDTMPAVTAAASPTAGANPLTVNFTGTVVGGEAPLTFAWDFGDGNTSTAQNPMHTYTMDGTFNAILTVTDADGDFDVDTVLVDVFTDTTPTATASAMPTNGLVPLAVAFTGTGTGGEAPLTYAWTFGDGVTSPLQSSNHTYMASGVFDATLTVTDVDGDFDQDTVQITVNPMPGNMPPTGSISANTTCAIPGLTQIQLTAAFTDPEMAVLSYSWVFTSVPAGSMVAFNNTTVMNPTFTPDLPGAYTMRVFVSDGVNNVASNTVTVDASGATNVSQVSGDNQTAQAGQLFSMPFAVNVINDCGLPVPGASINWTGSNAIPTSFATLTNGAGATTVTANAAGTVGPATITATAPSTGASVTFMNLLVNPGPPDRVVADYPADTGVVGPLTFVFNVTDAYGNVVTTTDVTFDLCIFNGTPTTTFDAPFPGGVMGCNTYMTSGGTISVDVYSENTGRVELEIIPISDPGIFHGGAANLLFDDLEAGDDGNWFPYTNGPLESWELGAPSVVGPPAAHSGSNVWGTDLNANYLMGTGFFLDGVALERGFDFAPYFTPFGPPTVTVSEWEFFDIYEQPGPCSDGGLMQLATCGFGGCVAPPNRGFDSNGCAVMEPGNAGSSGGWVPVSYDLTPWVFPGFMNLTWGLYRGPAATTGAGWYLDDISVDVETPGFVAGNFLAGPPAAVIVTNVNGGVAGCSDARIEAILTDAYGNPTGGTDNLTFLATGTGMLFFGGADIGFGFTPGNPATVDTDMGMAALLLSDSSAETVAVDVFDSAGLLTPANVLVTFTGLSPEVCGDGIDNDCANGADCMDPVCFGDPSCVGDTCALPADANPLDLPSFNYLDNICANSDTFLNGNAGICLMNPAMSAPDAFYQFTIPADGVYDVCLSHADAEWEILFVEVFDPMNPCFPNPLACYDPFGMCQTGFFFAGEFGFGVRPGAAGSCADLSIDVSQIGVCGDAICNAPWESPGNCPIDCAGPGCGDGFCDPFLGEDSCTCNIDCPGPCFGCGDGFCDPMAGEDPCSCNIDCPGPCGGCGDMICDPFLGEDSCTCVIDCPGPCFGCGDGFCDPMAGEDPCSCNIDCPGPCGGCNFNGICDWPAEDPANCPSDCQPCNGNAICEPWEDPFCPDCGGGPICGDGFCDVPGGEDPFTCAMDCPIVLESELMGGELIITEVMQNPNAVGDGSGEWFELYNNTPFFIDIDGLGIGDMGVDGHIIMSPGLIIAPFDYLVLGNNIDIMTNGGAPVAYQYASFTLGNADDEIYLTNSLGFTIDFIEWDGGPAWPDPAGASMNLGNLFSDNNDPANWCEATSPFGFGDLGTPGGPNDPCGPVAFCGDMVCDPSGGEDWTNCMDCFCGDGMCDSAEGFPAPPPPGLAVCSMDCMTPGVCGDGYCDPFIGEDVISCGSDCFSLSCGNLICEPGLMEDFWCGDCYCGDGICDSVESGFCPADGGPGGCP